MMRKSSSSESLQQNSDALHGQERMRTVRHDRAGGVPRQRSPERRLPREGTF